MQQFQNNSTVETPRTELRKRLSVAQYDNMVVYQYFHQLLEDLTQSIHAIEESLNGITLVYFGLGLLFYLQYVFYKQSDLIVRNG